MQKITRIGAITFLMISKAWALEIDIAKSDNEISIHLQKNAVSIEKYKGLIPLAQQFSDISYKNWPVNNQVGSPRVPFQSFILEGDLSEISLKVEAGEFTKFDVTPAPELKFPCRCAKDSDSVLFKYDAEAYEKSRPLYELKSLGDFRGKSLVQLNLYPFQVEDQKLQVYSDLKVNFENAKWLSYKMEEKKLLIVGPKDWLSAVDELVEKREADGFEVQVKEVDKIAKDPVKLKSFFQQTIKNFNYTHAIILGDETVTFMDKMKTSSSDETPSDLPYFLMGGKDDTVPDVLFGRFPAKTKKDVEAQVAKILAFEDKQDRGDFPKSVLGIASDEGASPSDVEYMDSMLQPFIDSSFAPRKVYQGVATHSNKDIENAFNNGLSWVNYIGHGSGFSWISVRDKEYTSAQVKLLKNNEHWPVIVDVACQNGRMSGDGRLGELFLQTRDSQGRPVGAVAFYGGTVDISWHPPAVMAVGINQILKQASRKEIGALLFEGQLHLIKNWRNQAEAIENWRWYNLMGDPTMMIDLF